MLGKKPLILIIDDEESMRDSCSLILTKEGCQTETAENGAIGLEKIKSIKPDLVLVDLKMPGISGMEVLERIREIDPNIISVVITGYATVESAVEAMKKGAYDFLPKPFTPEELRIIIHRGLEHRELILKTESLQREKRLMEENFITMVTHQLRSPLSAIVQFFEVILSDLISDKEKQKEMIQRAKSRVEGLLDLINDWLNLARMNEKQIVDKVAPMSVRKVLEKLVEFYEPLAAKEDISLEIIHSEGEDIVNGDESSLEQAFSNIITNAIKYNKPKGSVRVAILGNQTEVIVEVKDTGIGIAKEHLPFIFDQFYRVSRSEKEKCKGSGLGLTIAKKIIDLHGGRIEVESELGEGSIFRIFLPRAKA